jgi:hypothetical protein
MRVSILGGIRPRVALSTTFRAVHTFLSEHLFGALAHRSEPFATFVKSVDAFLGFDTNHVTQGGLT